jgi:hypothetical protein
MELRNYLVGFLERGSSGGVRAPLFFLKNGSFGETFDSALSEETELEPGMSSAKQAFREREYICLIYAPHEF